MAYATQGKPRERDMSTIQRFYYKGFNHYTSNDLKKFVITAKKMVILLKNILLDPQEIYNTYVIPIGSSNIGGLWIQQI